ncbi:MAG: hypothetical protein P8Y80_09045 [Acidobacteriota bacterium]
MTVLSQHSSNQVLPPPQSRAGQIDSGIASIRILMVLFALFLCTCVVSAALQEKVRTGNPHGRSIRLPCTNCHSTSGWQPIRSSPDFDHDSTGFRIEEMHADIECRHCHLDLVFSDIGTQCADCHADIHRRQLGPDCEECHTVRGWLEIRRAVNGHTNRFPLMGAHSALECQDCHTGAAVGLFRGLRTDCDFCHHGDDVNSEVDHQENGFSLNCEICHSMDTWLAGFNHMGFTGFAISGVHATIDCLDCHENANFVNTPADCVACHLQEYNDTTDPNHAVEGFSQDCSLCHSDISWTGAFSDHSVTQFPLDGAHTALLCQDCHSSGQYAGLPSDCYSCHAEDSDNAVDPAHMAAGFSQDCTECHTTSGWSGARYVQHITSYPIYSGSHNNRWTFCSDCHTNSGNYAVFSCFISCHDHDKAIEDPRHREVNGYVYNSESCYSCHRTGRRDD